MFKKLTYGFLSLTFVILTFTRCNEDCNDLPSSEKPNLRRGDTLIYTIDIGRKDTFRVDTLRYGVLTAGLSRTCYQTLRYHINRIDNSIIDTIGFNQINVSESAYTGLDLQLTNPAGVEYFYPADTIYQHKSIGGKDYTSVYYYSSKNSKTNCRNLYFNHQYGVLSIEINNHLIYLSEIRPRR
jgi:hypothetical protein